MEAKEFVARILAEKGWKPTELARRAGVVPSTINRFLSGKATHNLSATTLAKLANAAGTPNPFEPTLFVKEAEPYTIIDARVGGAGMIPIYGETGLPTKDVISFKTNEIQGWAPRRADLGGVMKAYCVYAAGNSMEPKYQPGQLLYVNPSKPARDNDFVLVRFKDGTGLVRRLLATDNQAVTVRAFNPARDTKLPLAEIDAIHRIAGADEV